MHSVDSNVYRMLGRRWAQLNKTSFIFLDFVFKHTFGRLNSNGRKKGNEGIRDLKHCFVSIVPHALQINPMAWLFCSFFKAIS